MSKTYFSNPHWDLYSARTEPAPARQPSRYTLGLWACVLLALLCFAPAAFSAPGDLDTSFNGTGFAIVPGDAGLDLSGEGLLVQWNGRVVAAASAYDDAGASRPMLARRRADGSADASFGTGGVVYPAVYGSDYLGAADLAQDFAGRILMVGLGADHVYVYRFLANGAPDASFGTAGLVTLDAPGVFSPVAGITLDLAGRIVVAANTRNATGHVEFLVARLKSNGTPDTTFNGTGIVHTALNANPTGVDLARAAVVQFDGRIVIGGRSRAATGDPYQFTLVRYTHDGALDASFGTGGVLRFAMGTGNSYGRRLLLQLDGRFVIAGSACDTAVVVDDEFCRAGVARVRANGTLDVGFGTGGRAYAELGPFGGYTFDVAQDWLGRIVVAGVANNTAANDGPTNAMTARFKLNGTLDGGYGMGGVALHSWGVPYSAGGNVAIGLDLSIYQSGSATDADGAAALAIARLKH